jgi:hypothetical protein
MALRVKLAPINSKVIFEGDGLASRETIGKAFASMVKKDIARVDGDNAAIVGRKVPHITAIGATQVAVLPDFIDPAAHVVARWQLEVGAVAYAWDALHRAGPVLKGAYRKSHRIYADGVEVAGPDDTAGAREVLILSIVPYARKIERGRKGYAPGAVYQAVTALTAARYGNVARIKFTYAEPEGPAGPLDAWAHRNASSIAHPRKRAAQLTKNRRQPAILFYF